MKLPKKILSRQQEITADFPAEVDKHLADIRSGKTGKMYHIKDFAALLTIHPVHLSNTIKMTTGHSPCYFYEEKLMDEARRRLQEGKLTIAGNSRPADFRHLPISPNSSNVAKVLRLSAYRQRL